MPPTLLRINLGGEGEVPDVINQQEPAALESNWLSSKFVQTLRELVADGHDFLICPNLELPFPDESVDEVITNSVPVDFVTARGPGVQSSEVRRILKSGGVWTRDDQMVYQKP